MKITEKTAYLKGLLEGLSIDRNKPEGKLLAAIIDTLDEMAAEVAGLTSETEHLEDYLDELDYDLGNLEADYYEAWDDDDDEDYDDEDYCYCDECDEDDCEDCELAEDGEKRSRRGVIPLSLCRILKKYFFRGHAERCDSRFSFLHVIRTEKAPPKNRGALFHILFPEIYTSLTEKSGLRTTKSARKPGSILPVSESPIISAGFEVAQGTAPAKGMFLNSE